VYRRLQQFFQSVSLEDEDAAVEEIARRVVREGMGAAAILFLETSKPVSFIAGQAAIFATPLIGGFIEPLRLERYADLFSRRDFVERVIRRIEELESERAAGKNKPPEEK
jgi:hypothetical protein